MAITIQEFPVIPAIDPDVVWPTGGADHVTTVTAPITHLTNPSTRFIIVTTDEDRRMMIGAPAVSDSSLPILAAMLNTFRLEPGSATPLKFI